LDDARIRANRVECARIRAKIRKAVKMERASRVECAASRVECARAITTCAKIRAKIRHNNMLLLLLTPIELRALAKDHGIPCSDDHATDLAAHLDIAASRDDLPPLHAKVTAGPETTWVEYQEQHSEQANGLVGLLQAYFEYGEEYAIFNEMAEKTAAAVAEEARMEAQRQGGALDPAVLAAAAAAAAAASSTTTRAAHDSDDDSDLYWGKC
jgi:hypothetical protein